MPPVLLAPDRQHSYTPVWFMSCAAFPRVYATRTIDIPFVVPGVIFTVGDSVVGGEDLVGGGAGPQFKQAFRGILNTPVVTRTIGDPAWPMVQVSDVTVELKNENGELNGDWKKAPFTLSAYDAESGFLLTTGDFLVANAVHDRGKVTITGKNLDESILEAQIPKGVITLEEFPLAAPDAVGVTPTWLLGNVPNLSLPNVRDDQIKSQFDYLVCRDAAAAITGLRRVMPGGVNPFITMSYEELEPYPGMDGATLNPSFEGWDAGATSNPDDWTTNAGATIAKNITPAQVSEGSASAALTRVGADCRLSQDLAVTALPFVPLTWWQGREITVVVDVHATVAARGLIRVSDGVTDFDSPFHTGGGLIEMLTVGTELLPCVINAAATRVRVEGRIHTGNTTVTFDNVRVYIRAKSFAECLRPDLYDGYTAIRTFLRQEDASGSLYQIAADVKGLQPERNMIRAIRSIASSQAHALGKTVDPVTFDAEEIKACFVYEDAVNLDGPEVFLPFRDAFTDFTAATQILRDRSGHERHALYTLGVGQIIDNFYAFGFGISETAAGTGGYSDAFFWGEADGDWIAIPDAPAFSGQAITAELWFEIVPGGLPDANPYPIIEKTVAGASGSQYGLFRQSNQLVWQVRCVDTNLYSVTSPLVDGVDENRWMHIACTATGGVLQMFRDGVLVATGSYAAGGDIVEGVGEVLIGKFGTPNGAITPSDIYAKPALYSSALSAARIAAHFAAKTLDVADRIFYDNAVETHANLVDSWRCDDATAGTSIAGVHVAGTWNGAPPLASGPLNPEHGYVNSGGGKHFANDVTDYGVVTGQTYALAAGSVACWYRPTTASANAGILEKTIAGVRDTQWSVCQRSAAVRFRLVTSAGAFTADAPLLAADVGRYGFYIATWDSGVLTLTQNDVVVATTAYTGTPASGVGDLYFGIQGTVSAVRTRPGQGDIGRVSIFSVALTAAEKTRFLMEGTWYNGGLCVDGALLEPRAARTWLAQICLMRGIRLGMTPDGPITVTVDAAPATTIRLHARDGAGDGERTIKDIGGLSHGPPLDDEVSTLVVKGRRDLLSNAWLVERRRTVGVLGKEEPVELECVREYPALDRVAGYLAGRRIAGRKKVDKLEMGQEARQLMEGELVMVTDAHLGLSEEIMEVQEIAKSLPTHTAKVQGWSEAPYTWTPESYPSGARSG